MWGVSFLRNVIVTSPASLKASKQPAELLALFKDRGLQIEDEDRALQAIKTLGYYRLTGYAYPLRQTEAVGSGLFKQGATLSLVIELAKFDKQLRLLALDGLETIELAVRVAIANRLGAYDPEAHLNPKLLDGRFSQVRSPQQKSPYERWKSQYEEKLLISKEEFVQHHKVHYGGRLPIWVAVELWDFGMMSKFFAGMASRDRSHIASELGALEGEILKSWLRMFNFVRNVSAHHGRLWNRRNTETLALPALERCRWLEPLHRHEVSRSKVFGAFCCIALMLRTISPGSTWSSEVKRHLETFPISELISMKTAGFPSDWRHEHLWQ